MMDFSVVDQGILYVYSGSTASSPLNLVALEILTGENLITNYKFLNKFLHILVAVIAKYIPLQAHNASSKSRDTLTAGQHTSFSQIPVNVILV